MQEMEYTARAEWPRPSIFAANLMSLVSIVGLWLGSLLAILIAPKAGLRQDITVNVVYYLPFIVIPIAVYMRRRPGLSEAMRLNPMPLFPALSVMLLALLSVFAAMGIDAIWVRLLEEMGLHEPEAALSFDSSRALMLSVINSAALPAVCEELLFRGFVLSAWERRGTGLAIWVSTALFALLHSNVYGLPAYLLVGAVSAALVFCLDSLYAGILYHTVYNAAILVIVYLSQGSEPAAGQVPGVLSIAVELIVLLAMMAMLLISLRFRSRAMGIEPLPRAREPLTGRERAMLVAAVAAMAVSTLAALLWGGGA